MTRPRDLQREAETPEPLPAGRRVDRMTPAFLHVLRDFRAGPQAAIGGTTPQGRQQRLLLPRIQQGLGAVLASAVTQPIGPMGVPPFEDLGRPRRREADDRGRGVRRVPLARAGEQPNDVPACFFTRVRTRAVTVIDLLGREMFHDRNGLHGQDSFQVGRPSPPFLSIKTSRYEATLKEILTADQRTRLQQLFYQACQFWAFSGPGERHASLAVLHSELKLTDDQKTQIRTVFSQYVMATRNAQTNAGKDRNAYWKAVAALNVEYTNATVSYLTPEQKMSWDRLCGAPFDIQRLQAVEQ